MSNTMNTIVGPVQIGVPTREYSSTDLAAFQQVEPLLRNAGMDVDHEYAVANAKPITDYFENNRNTAISVQSIVDFVYAKPKLFKIRTPAQRRFDAVVATEGVLRGQQMLDYLAGQRSLINSGDQLFENAAELLQELHGRPITPESVHAAIGRISAPTSRFDTRRRGQLHFAHGPARKLSQAAQQDDPNRKHGVFIEKFSNGPASLHHNHAHDTEDTPTTPATITGAAQSEALSIRGNTHSQTVMLQKIFVTKLGTTDVDWNATLEARRRMQQEFSNKRIR